MQHLIAVNIIYLWGGTVYFPVSFQFEILVVFVPQYLYMKI